jgi:hypothetical protein
MPHRRCSQPCANPIYGTAHADDNLGIRRDGDRRKKLNLRCDAAEGMQF